MRRIVPMFAVMGLIAAVGCIPSPPELCQRGVDLTCTRLFECQPDAVKSADAFKGIYGTSVAECKTKLEALAKCSEKKEQNELCASNPDGGTALGTYDISKASECSDKKKAQTCTDFLDVNKTPDACKVVCKY